MPRFVKGEHAIETSNAREGVQLRAAGYREEKARTKAVKSADSKPADKSTDSK